jgi:hypothetical protein
MAFVQPLAAPATPVAADDSQTAVASSVRIPALTPVRLRVVGEVSSSSNVKGDKVRLVLAEALRFGDDLVIPAGTPGSGEVIHSAKPGMGGKAGELLVAARSLDLAPDVHIPLRSFRLDPAAAKNNQGLANGLLVAGGVAGSIAALMITGGSARIADGSEAFAKTAADVDVAVAPQRPAPVPAAPAPAAPAVAAR